MRFYFLLMICLLSLIGCSPVSIKQNAYQIDTVPKVAVKKTHARTIMVLNPDANLAYRGTGIAYTTCSPYSLAYYSKNVWAEPPAKMLQNVVTQALQNSHYYRVVLTPAFLGNYDYGLSMQLIELRQDFTMGPRSVVRMKVNAQLSRNATNQVIAARQFSVIVPARYNNPYGAVLAANEATRMIASQIVFFVEHHS